MTPVAVAQIDDATLLQSVQSLVLKERELARLLVEEKEAEVREWHTRCKELQEELTGGEAPRASVPVPVSAPERATFAAQPTGAYSTLLATRREPDDAALATLRSSSALDLSRQQIDAARLIGAASKLRWIGTLTRLDLSRNMLTDASADTLGLLLVELKLVHLDLSYNDLGLLATASILGRLGRDRCIECLRLHGNMPLAASPGAGAAVVKALTAASKAGGCQKLHAFSVTLNDYEDRFRPAVVAPPSSAANAAAAAAAAAKATRGKKSPPMNALAFAKMLSQKEPKPPLSALALPHARLHPRTVAELAQRAPTTLTDLHLSDCFIGAAGAAAFAAALVGKDIQKGLSGAKTTSTTAQQPTLTALRLRQNAAGAAGAAALAKALLNSRSLTMIDLRSNYVGDSGAVALVSSASRNPLMALVDLRDNAVSNRANEAIKKALDQRPPGAAVLCVRGASLPMQENGAHPGCGQTNDSRSTGNSSSNSQTTLASAEEELCVPLTRGDAEGFVEVYRLSLPALSDCSSSGSDGTDGLIHLTWLCRRESASSGKDDSRAADSESGLHFKWRVVRRRSGSSDEKTKRGGSGGSRAIPVKEGRSEQGVRTPDGYWKLRAQTSGWEADDELSVWILPCDSADKPLPPAARARVGPVRCRGLVVQEGADPEHNLLYGDACDLLDDLDASGEDVRLWHSIDGSTSASGSFVQHVTAQVSHSGGVPDFSGALLQLREAFVAASGTIRVQWECRLTVKGGGADSGAPNDATAAARRLLAGLTWALVRCRSGLPPAVVAQGTCRPHANWGGASSATVASGSIASPRKWSQVSAVAPSCLPGDVLSLCARPDLKPEAAAALSVAQRAAALAEVKVEARAFRMYAVDGGTAAPAGNGVIAPSCSEVVRLDFWGPHCMNHARAGGAWA